MPEIEVKIKNSNSKLGRKDWDGRSPRYRWSITLATAMILKEWAEVYFLNRPQDEQNVQYKELQGKVIDIIDYLQKPLTSETEHFPLLEEEFKFE